MSEQTAPQAQTEAAEPRLKHFPISFFALVMGLSGLTLAAERLEMTLGMKHSGSLVLLIIALVVFITIAALYGLKAARYWDDVVWEWHHPVRMAFFPTASISIILLATAAMPFSAKVAFVWWTIGATLHLIGTLSVVSAWIGHRAFETPHLNPAWFIPAVGNALVPIAGVPLGFPEISWFFFSVGMLFWIVLLTLVFNRLIFHTPLPERLFPTLVILVAPPAVGFVAYMRLAGELDSFARILYYGGVAFFLVVALQLPRLLKLPFALSWWALSFPIAAITVATLLYAEKVGSAGLQTFGIGLFIFLVLAILVLAARTTKAILAHKVCVPEK
ncbi:MAG: SLAC1 anion channel family protein [Hyphomicrobiales bacterium]